MRVVVGAAVLRDGLVLLAHRLGHGWEFPGGKVEPGESQDDALVREVAEELGCTVEVVDWLPVESPIGGDDSDLVLRVALARLVAGEPRATEHDELRWVGPDQLDALDWLPADRPVLPAVRRAIAAARTARD